MADVSSPVPSRQLHVIQEGAAGTIVGFTLRKQDATPVEIVILSVGTLTYVDPNNANAIINNRNGQAIINQNNVTYHATNGELRWTLQLADLAQLHATRRREQHVARFHFEWAGATPGRFDHEVVIEVVPVHAL